MGGIFWVILLVLGAVAMLWIMRARSRSDAYPPPIERRSLGLNILEERYAKGEVERDETLQKKRDLDG